MRGQNAPKDGKEDVENANAVYGRANDGANPVNILVGRERKDKEPHRREQCAGHGGLQASLGWGHARLRIGGRQESVAPEKHGAEANSVGYEQAQKGEAFLVVVEAMQTEHES